MPLVGLLHMMPFAAAPECWTEDFAEAQRNEACTDFCGELALRRTWTKRGSKYCYWCSCNVSSCDAGALSSHLTPDASKEDFEAAQKQISSAVTAGRPPPLFRLLTLVDSVTHHAQKAMYQKGFKRDQVMQFFKSHGDIASEPAQILAYARALGACAPSPPRSICEVGFFAGQSATIFLALSAAQQATYTAVDLLSYPFSAAMADWITTAFPGRARVLKGRSQDVVTATTPALSNCDVWSLDGAHTPHGLALDVLNALRASPRTATVVVDDVTNNASQAVVPIASVRSKAKHAGLCQTNPHVWDSVERKVTKLQTKECVVAGRKLGTPNWCSAWCVAFTRSTGKIASRTRNPVSTSEAGSSFTADEALKEANEALIKAKRAKAQELAAEADALEKSLLERSRRAGAR